MKKYLVNFVAVMAVAASCMAAQAESLNKVGENLLGKYGNAVVEIQAVSKMNIELGSMGTQKQENKLEVAGTILNKDGLIVTSYSALHPSHLVSSAEIPSPMGQINATISGETGDLRVRYADGQLVNAQLVLKDPEMDLAFIKPESKVAKQQTVAGAKVGKFSLLDQGISLKLSSKLSRHTPILLVDRILSIVKKPSKMYLASSHSSATGAPIFNDRGELVGINLIKGEAGAKVSGNKLTGNTIRIIRPIKEILAAAEQVEK